MVNIGKHIIEVLYNSICQLLAFKDLFVWSVDGHGFYKFHGTTPPIRGTVSFCRFFFFRGQKRHEFTGQMSFAVYKS